jgi:transposase
MERKLSSQERTNLISSHRKERDGRVRDRIKAVIAYDDGYSYSEISRILLLDDETIRRHITDYFKYAKLAPESGGSTGHLDDQDTKKLKSHLQEVTYLYVKEICAYVKKTFQKKYSISGMTKWLHANNFSYKKPHGLPAKADKNQQQDFIKTYNKLKKKSADKEPIYFSDSVHPQHQTRLSYGWILKGERKEIPTTARQNRVNLIGGICLNGQKLVYKQAEQVNAYSIKLFLDKLRQTHHDGNKIHVIWDNAGYHRSKKVKRHAKILNIKLHYLPPYSPNLNPIERLWKIMHEHVTYNKYYEKFSEFTDAVLDFFKTIGRKKTILKSRITDNFQILGNEFAF